MSEYLNRRYYVIASYEAGNEAARESMLDKIHEVTADGKIGACAGGGYNVELVTGESKIAHDNNVTYERLNSLARVRNKKISELRAELNGLQEELDWIDDIKKTVKRNKEC